MSTDPRSGLSPSVAQPGDEPSPQQPMVTVLALAEIRRRKQLNQGLLVRASWERLDHVFDLLVEMHVSMQQVGANLWRSHCVMCGHTSYVDLHDRLHVGHGAGCLIGRLCDARRPVDRALGWLLDALTYSAERRQPDTTPDCHPTDQDLSAGTPRTGRAVVEQPSPKPVTSETRIDAAQGKAAAR